MLALGILPTLTGCATGESVADTQYQKSDEMILAHEDFERRKAVCQKNGGSMKIRAKPTKLRRHRHTAADYRQAYCE